MPVRPCIALWSVPVRGTPTRVPTAALVVRKRCAAAPRCYQWVGEDRTSIGLILRMLVVPRASTVRKHRDSSFRFDRNGAKQKAPPEPTGGGGGDGVVSRQEGLSGIDIVLPPGSRLQVLAGSSRRGQGRLAVVGMKSTSGSPPPTRRVLRSAGRQRRRVDSGADSSASARSRSPGSDRLAERIP